MSTANAPLSTPSVDTEFTDTTSRLDPPSAINSVLRDAADLGCTDLMMTTPSAENVKLMPHCVYRGRTHSV